MEKILVKDWLEKLLTQRFKVNDKSIKRLTYLDLFYLYVEIYKQYGIKLPVEVISQQNFEVDLIVDYICKVVSN